MKSIYLAPLFSLLLAATLNANAAGSALRVTCEGDDVGAEVLVNGKFKGECPVDLQVPAGTVKLLVRKKVDGGERRFYQEFRLGDGAAKKVEVWSLELVAESEYLMIAKKAESGDAGAMASVAGLYRAVALARRAWGGSADNVRRNYEQALRWGLKAIEAGAEDPSLMFQLGDMYVEGSGTDVDEARGSQLYKRGLELAQKNATKGDTHAMTDLADAYVYGRGVSVNKAEASRWLHKAKDKGADVDYLFKLYKLE